MIDNFRGEYFFLSNFYPCKIIYGNITYRSVEHAFQAAKTLDMDKRKLIAAAGTAAAAKHLGRLVPLRADWEEIKLATMENLLRIKFSNHILKQKLIQTGDQELTEGNWWGDNF
jgi:hypothetical protein